jgi:hypothetical protein
MHSRTILRLRTEYYNAKRVPSWALTAERRFGTTQTIRRQKECNIISAAYSKPLYKATIVRSLLNVTEPVSPLQATCQRCRGGSPAFGWGRVVLRGHGHVDRTRCLSMKPRGPSKRHHAAVSHSTWSSADAMPPRRPARAVPAAAGSDSREAPVKRTMRSAPGPPGCSCPTPSISRNPGHQVVLRRGRPTSSTSQGRKDRRVQ